MAVEGKGDMTNESFIENGVAGGGIEIVTLGVVAGALGAGCFCFHTLIFVGKNTMKISVTVEETLTRHDIPQLFVAKDLVGVHYLCLAVNADGVQPHYIAVAISQVRLQQLKTGKIDLYSIFANPEMGMWFQITSFEETCAVAESIPEMETLPGEWLPEPGAFLPVQPMLRPETFEAVKVVAVAKEAGMNPTLLRQYLSGVKRPSPEQARRVQDALHRLARRLLEVRFV